MKKSTISCCQNCTDRHSGCHGKCETYQQEKKQWDDTREQLREQKRKDRILAYNAYKHYQ